MSKEGFGKIFSYLVHDDFLAEMIGTPEQRRKALTHTEGIVLDLTPEEINEIMKIETTENTKRAELSLKLQALEARLYHGGKELGQRKPRLA